MMVPVEELDADPLAGFENGRSLEELERLLLLRVIENGTLPLTEIPNVLKLRQESGKSIGER